MFFFSFSKVKLYFSVTLLLTSKGTFNFGRPEISSFGKGLTLYHTSRSFNPFPNNPWFLHVCSESLLKTLWEKEKLLVMSNFSFSHSVFYPFGGLCAISSNLKLSSTNSFEFGIVLILSFGKGLTTQKKNAS